MVAATLPTKDAFAPIRTAQARMLTATVLLSLLLGALTWWLVRKQLAPAFSTLKALTAQAQSDRPPQALSIARDDEIGQLVDGFNRLIATLGERENALRESEQRFQALHDASFGGISNPRLSL